MGDIVHEHKKQIARKLEEMAAQRQDDELNSAMSEAASDDVQGIQVVVENEKDTNESERQEDASNTRNAPKHIPRCKLRSSLLDPRTASLHFVHKIS